MPSPRRDRTGGAPRVLRGLTAVAALYALVLQALLGGIAALPVTGAPAFLCQPIAQQIADGAVSAGAAKDGLPAPDSHHAGCCTAAHHPPAALPPPLSAAITWPDREAARAGWSGARSRTARPPPFTLAHARAPPAA